MALHDAKRMSVLSAAGSPTTQTIDNAADKIGGIFIAPKDGTIDRMVCFCQAVSSPPDFKLRLEGVSQGPSGTLLDTNTETSGVTPTASTQHAVSLTASYTVAAGEPIGGTLEWDSGTIGASNFGTFNMRQAAGGNLVNPRAFRDTGSGWTAQSLIPCISPVYDDGSFFPCAALFDNVGSVTWNDSDSTDEYACEHALGGDATIYGVSAYMRTLTAGATFDFRLYDGGTQHRSVSLQSEDASSISSTGWMDVYFDPYEASSGATLRYSIRSTNNTDIRVSVINTITQQGIQALFGPMGSTSRSNGGSWSCISYSTFYSIVPIIAADRSGGGGGGSAFPVVIGG